MGQQENVKKLTDAWKRSKLTQQEFADLLGINRSYFSTLIHLTPESETDVQQWILDKAEEIEHRHVANTTSGVTLQEPQTEYRTSTKVQDCHNYLQAFLDNCQNDPDKVSWTLIELREKFPLDKWKK